MKFDKINEQNLHLLLFRFIGKKNMKKVLIISTGILSAHLSKFLLNKNYKIYVTSRILKKKYKNFDKLRIQKKIIFKKAYNY